MGDQTLKQDIGKPDWSVFPFKETEEVLKVFEYGAIKYGRPFSYREGIDSHRLWTAAVRHLLQMQQKGYFSCDDESSRMHAAHVAANMLMIISQYLLAIQKEAEIVFPTSTPVETEAMK